MLGCGASRPRRPVSPASSTSESSSGWAHAMLPSRRQTVPLGPTTALRGLLRHGTRCTLPGRRRRRATRCAPLTECTHPRLCSPACRTCCELRAPTSPTPAPATPLSWPSWGPAAAWAAGAWMPRFLAGAPALARLVHGGAAAAAQPAATPLRRALGSPTACQAHSASGAGTASAAVGRLGNQFFCPSLCCPSPLLFAPLQHVQHRSDGCGHHK